MQMIWRYMKPTLFILLTIGLIFSSSVFTVLIYGKITGKDWAMLSEEQGAMDQPTFSEAQSHTVPLQKPYSSVSNSHFAVDNNLELDPNPKFDTNLDSISLNSEAPSKKTSAILDAPIYLQYPELYNGCEVTSLSMLLNYYGIERSKLDLAPELVQDPTPVKLDNKGNIVSWGNPNIGFVGDVYGKSMGFGIFHGALLKLMEQYIPSSVDLTGEAFEALEQQISDGFPVIIWTTNDFRAPESWIQWESPLGPFRTTMKEHAVLMVGYDESYIYVNDPMSGKAQFQVEKKRFIEAWEAMGKQALSYTEPIE